MAVTRERVSSTGTSGSCSVPNLHGLLHWSYYLCSPTFVSALLAEAACMALHKPPGHNIAYGTMM